MARREKGWDGPVDYTYPGITLAVLVEIREELKMLNSTFRCKNFLAIPRTLDTIATNTKKRERKK